MKAKKVLDEMVGFEGPRFGRWSCSLRVGTRVFQMTIERCPEIASDRIVFDWIIVEGTAQEREVASGSKPSFRTAGDAVTSALAELLTVDEVALLNPAVALPKTKKRIAAEVKSFSSMAEEEAHRKRLLEVAKNWNRISWEND